MQRDRRIAGATLGLGAALGLLAFGSVLASRTPDPARSLSFGALSFSGALACVAFALAAFGSEPVARRLGLGRSNLEPRTIALLALGIIGLSGALESAIALAGLREGSVLPLLDHAAATARGADRILVLLALGIVPGVAEELFCRGWLQRGLAGRLSPPLAIAATAAVFGALHGDPVHAAAAFALGLYLGWVAWIGSSVRPAMACHVANNVVAVGWPILAGATGEQHGPLALGAFLVVGASVSALALRAALRGQGQERRQGGAAPGFLPPAEASLPVAGEAASGRPSPGDLQTAPRAADE